METRTWLVTGGAGYIGSHIVRALAAAGQRAVVLDDLSNGEAARLGDVPLVRGSVLDADLVRGALEEHRVHGVLHIAARKAVAESVARPLYYYDENVGGLHALLRAMRDAAVDRLVFTSSAAVYGSPPVGLVSEDTPCVPANPYGQTKLVGEWLVDAAARAYGLRYVALRYFNVAGAADALLADRGVTNLVPLALQAVREGERPQVYGTDYDTHDGTCVRDYVHVADVARAHVDVLPLLEDPACTEVFNVGTGEGYSVLDVMAMVRKVTGSAVEPVALPRRAGDPARVVADVSRIRDRLGWRSRHTLEDMIRGAWAAMVGRS